MVDQSGLRSSCSRSLVDGTASPIRSLMYEHSASITYMSLVVGGRAICAKAPKALSGFRLEILNPSIMLVALHVSADETQLLRLSSFIMADVLRSPQDCRLPAQCSGRQISLQQVSWKVMCEKESSLKYGLNCSRDSARLLYTPEIK